MSRADICARPATHAAKVAHLQVYDVYRVNNLTRTVYHWQEKATPTDKSDLALNNILGGLPDAAHGDQTKDGKCRLDAAPLDRSCHLLPWPPASPAESPKAASVGKLTHLVK